MNQKIRLQTFDRDDGPEPKEIADHLRAEVESEFGPADRRAVWISAHDGGRLVGGLRGFSHWGWLYIAQLWVDEAVRAQGVGAELLKAAETEARARGCAGLYVDTFSPRAKLFYEKNGFVLFGELPDQPPGFQRYFLRKPIEK